MIEARAKAPLAIKTGVGYIPQTLTLVAFSAIGQSLVTKVGVRRIFPLGLVLAGVSFVLFAQLPTCSSGGAGSHAMETD